MFTAHFSREIIKVEAEGQQHFYYKNLIDYFDTKTVVFNMMSTMLSLPPPTANIYFLHLKLQINKNLEITIKDGLLAKTYIIKEKYVNRLRFLAYLLCNNRTL